MTPVLRDELRTQSIRTEPGGPVVALAVYGPVRLDWLAPVARLACDVLCCDFGALVACARPATALGAAMVFVARDRAACVEAMEWCAVARGVQHG